MKRSLALLPAVAFLFWVAIAIFFGPFLSLGEKALYALGWTTVSVGLAGALTLVLAAGYRLIEQRPAVFAPLLFWGLWLALAIWLGVSMVSFRPLIVEYRGITNLTTCGQALAVVMDLGVAPTETERDADGKGNWYLFEGESDLGAEEIAVLCDDAKLISVSSQTLASTAAAAAVTGQENLTGPELLETLHRHVHGRLAEVQDETEIRPTLDGFESRWCFDDPRTEAEARIGRMFLVEYEPAELYASTRREPDDGFRMEVGLSLAGGECRVVDPE